VDNDEDRGRLRDNPVARAEMDAARLRAHVVSEAAKRPRLTPDQIARLRRLFRPRA